MQLTISATANIPAKLELSGIAVTGKAIADLVVKVLYADSTDFETLTTTTDVTLDEASGGWYRIIINSAKVDLAGMLLVQISSATLAFDTKEYLHEIVAASAGNVIQINGVASAAAKLSLSASTMIAGTITDAALAPTATNFECSDITDATADHYNGRVIIFTSGGIIRQAQTITDYAKVGSNGRFVTTAFTTAPANGDTLIVV
jgi:hypothetical protein